MLRVYTDVYDPANTVLLALLIGGRFQRQTQRGNSIADRQRGTSILHYNQELEKVGNAAVDCVGPYPPAMVHLWMYIVMSCALCVLAIPIGFGEELFESKSPLRRCISKQI